MRRLTGLLFAAIPLAFLFEYGVTADWRHTAVFLCAAAGIIPLAGLMGRATEGLAARAGPAAGAFLNASLGNAAELIIALVALFHDKYDIVQASITGAIIGNILFILGLSCVLGGWRRERQSFSAVAAESGVAMLYVSVAGLSIPSILVTISHFSPKGDIPDQHVHAISVATSVILLAVYAASLLFVFKTHRHVFVLEGEEVHARREPMGGILALLVGSAVLIGFLAEFLAGSVDHAARRMGFNEIFVGVMIVAVVGNAAEHAAAIQFAMKDRMNLAMNIAIESSKQIALFVAPLLVIVGALSGHPLTLAFTPMEAAAIGISVVILALLVLDGRSNWLEGVMLLAVYAILGVAFYFTKSLGVSPASP